MIRRSIVLLIAGVPTVAHAHFVLNAPGSATQQDEFGSPQKSAPCGLTDRAGVPDDSTPSGVVTTVRTGSTLTISIRETIFHPGHFRVALAPTMAGLPADPAVTPGSTACGATTIDATPDFPVLADGQLVHTSGFGNRDMTFDVPLPAGMTCTNCVLQVTQFMSNHALNNPGGCFYHHCATVTISDDAPLPDAGTGGGGDGDGGTGGGGDDGGGCCGTAGNPAVGAGLALLVLALVARSGGRRSGGNSGRGRGGSGRGGGGNSGRGRGGNSGRGRGSNNGSSGPRIGG
ncbi:MAG TPA: SCE4755 family polysaccharide monooxygenase-like protein [Kofleriaceae bacterium]|nr:SCE4755 family polysaccharide monooxygenase-like protein [Kofleriaceae bacterium]